MDGYFEPWSDWSECSVTCATGSQTRQRVCVEPLYAGSECSGPRDEERNCTMIECPGNVSAKLPFKTMTLNEELLSFLFACGWCICIYYTAICVIIRVSTASWRTKQVACSRCCPDI